MGAANILEVRDLHVQHQADGKVVDLVDGVSLTLAAGETLGIVGESGCGKSVTMMSLLRLLPPQLGASSGEAVFEGEDLLKLSPEALRQVRGGRVGFIFQDPMTSFNPVLTIGDQMIEPLIYHRGMNRAEAMAEAGRLMRLVGIPGGERRLTDYPHQLSGGMRQRVMIAMSIACEPRLLIADEPTTALDVTMQAQIVELVAELRRSMGLSVIWITHDLALVSQLADRIAVLYSGRVVEEGTMEDICFSPRHPYTQGLLASMPAHESTSGSRHLPSIPGLPPDPARRPKGCAFAPRCSRRIDRCLSEKPELKSVANGQRAACFVAQMEAVS